MELFMDVGRRRCFLSLMSCLLLFACDGGTVSSQTKDPVEDVADQIDSFMSVFLTTTASMNPTSDLCDRLGSDRGLSIEVRMARALIAVYKKEPIEGEKFQGFVKALIHQEIETSKLMAKRESFIADMTQIVEDQRAKPAAATDQKEISYNSELTPELAKRVLLIAATIKKHSSEELSKARAERRAAILAYAKKHPDKVAAITKSAPSAAVIESRKKVKAALDAAR